jgi:hypothetical protein
MVFLPANETDVDYPFFRRLGARPRPLFELNPLAN